MDYDAARRNMVDCQILPNRVTDERVVAAMLDVPREAFAPKERRDVAYVDEALGLGDGRFIMEPLIIARLLQVAELKSGDVALAIGCGTGYAAAVMAGIVSTVVAIERDKGLIQQAERTLAELEIDNVAVIKGDLAEGYAKQAPYDVIFFDGAVEEIPAAISEQLGEGGRLVAVVVDEAGIGRAMLMARYRGILSSRPVFDAGTPKLPGFERAQPFVF